MQQIFSSINGQDLQQMLKSNFAQKLEKLGTIPLANINYTDLSAVFKSGTDALFRSPVDFVRTIIIYAAGSLPAYIAIPACCVIALLGFVAVRLSWRAFRFAFFGAGHNLLMWSLTASSRQDFIDKILRERSAETAKFVAWATSGPSPSLKERHALAKLTIPQLRDKMKAGELSPVFLLKAYVLNANDAHTRTNCIAGWCVDRAIAAAKSADAMYSSYADGGQAARETVDSRPLLGIPISIKECVKVAGAYSTAGCIYFAQQNGRCAEDSALPQTLAEQGAVIFATTSVPQTMLSFECQNRIYGVTDNAHKKGYSPGGSSGGEGALIACGGSTGGVMTDIGGSIRIPAANNGIFGLKPSLFRSAFYGGTTPTAGQEGVSSTPGPGGRSLEDVIEFFKCMVAQPDPRNKNAPQNFGCAVDGTMMYTPWRDEMFQQYADKKRKLRIGVSYDDGWLALSPAMRRAVKETADAAKKAGHEVVEFQMPHVVKVMELFYQLMSSDCCETVSRKFDGATEPPMKAVLITYLTGRVFPTWVFNTLIPFFMARKSPILANGLRNLGEKDVASYYAALADRNKMRTEVARACFGANQFDCLLLPAFATPATRNGSTVDKTWAVSYTAFANVLDLSAVSMPVGTVDADKDCWTADRANGSSAKPHFDFMDQQLRAIYDAKEMEGLPIGVQLLGPRGAEERVLGCAQQIADACGAKSTWPTWLDELKE